MDSRSPTVARSTAGLWTERQLRLAHRAHINDTWPVRASISTPVLAGLATAVVHLASSRLRAPFAWSDVLLTLVALALIFVGLWATWTIDADRKVRALRAKWRAEVATAAVLDQVPGVAALHDRRLGRFGVHLDHVVVADTVVVVIGNRVGIEGAGPEQDLTRRELCAELREAKTVLEERLRVRVLALAVDDTPLRREGAPNPEADQGVLVLPRDRLAAQLPELIANASPSSSIPDLLERVVRLCPPMLSPPLAEGS